MTENKRFLVYGNEIVQGDECWAVAYSEYNADVIATALNELAEENQQLKAQISANSEEGVCSICKYCYLVKHQDMQGYYIAKCEKEHEECSKEAVGYCEDFELMVK